MKKFLLCISMLLISNSLYAKEKYQLVDSIATDRFSEVFDVYLMSEDTESYEKVENDVPFQNGAAYQMQYIGYIEPKNNKEQNYKRIYFSLGNLYAGQPNKVRCMIPRKMETIEMPYQGFLVQMDVFSGESPMTNTAPLEVLSSKLICQGFSESYDSTIKYNWDYEYGLIKLTVTAKGEQKSEDDDLILGKYKIYFSPKK